MPVLEHGAELPEPQPTDVFLHGKRVRALGGQRSRERHAVFELLVHEDEMNLSDARRRNGRLSLHIEDSG